MDIYVVNLSNFTQTEYRNAKSITFDYDKNQYIITTQSGGTVRYTKSAVLVGIRP